MGFPTPSSCHALFIAPLPSTTTATNALSSSLHGGCCQPLRRRHATVSQRHASRRRSHLPLSTPVHMHAKSRKKQDVQSSERPEDDLNVDLKSNNNNSSSSSSTTNSKQSSQPQLPSQQDQMLPPPILPTLTTLTNSTSSSNSTRSDEEELVSSIASLTSPGATSSSSADAPDSNNSSNSNSILPQDPQLAQMGAGFSQKQESELVKFLKETVDEFQIIEWTPFIRIIRLTILVIVVIVVSTASLYVIDGFLTRVANYAFRDLF